MLSAKRVVCGISGGVDSCVSALILKRKGFEVIGVFMRNWDIADETGKCSAAKDHEDAQLVCEKLEIPFHEVNFVKQYWNDVFTPLLQDYQAGFTPNPDVLCNRHIKFRSFLQYAREKHDAFAIATGHYAQTSLGPFMEKSVAHNQVVKLLKARDVIKDQTLFLSQISQDALNHTMFPIGGMLKNSVKYMAKTWGFKNIAEKKESTGICFIGKRNFTDFMREYSKACPGRFVDVDSGKVVGRHEGIQFFTLGQRALIGGQSAPYFIAHKSPATNDIFVALGHDNPAMYCDTLNVVDMHWICGPPSSRQDFSCDFRFQHAHPVTPCTVSFAENPGSLTVTLRDKQFALTPGQYAVFYKGAECLGSGRIASSRTSKHLDEVYTKQLDVFTFEAINGETVRKAATM